MDNINENNEYYKYKTRIIKMAPITAEIDRREINYNYINFLINIKYYLKCNKINQLNSHNSLKEYTIILSQSKYNNLSTSSGSKLGINNLA